MGCNQVRNDTYSYFNPIISSPLPHKLFIVYKYCSSLPTILVSDNHPGTICKNKIQQ